MNGQWLGRRTIRTNWATRKPTGTNDSQYGRTELSYDDVFNQTGPENTSVYVGNVNSAANGKVLLDGNLCASFLSQYAQFKSLLSRFSSIAICWLDDYYRVGVMPVQ